MFGVAGRRIANINDEQRAPFTEMQCMDITQLFKENLKDQSSNESNAHL